MKSIVICCSKKFKEEVYSFACFVYNKDNYIGRSVAVEMGLAQALGKPIYALTPETGDPCSNVLIDKVVTTPEALVRLLS